MNLLVCYDERHEGEPCEVEGDCCVDCDQTKIAMSIICSECNVYVKVVDVKKCEVEGCEAETCGDCDHGHQECDDCQKPCIDTNNCRDHYICQKCWDNSPIEGCPQCAKVCQNCDESCKDSDECDDHVICQSCYDDSDKCPLCDDDDDDENNDENEEDEVAIVAVDPQVFFTCGKCKEYVAIPALDQQRIGGNIYLPCPTCKVPNLVKR